MNKTQAKFTTTSIPQVAFLLWKDIVPDDLECELSHHLFLYFRDDDYISIARRYWEGDYVPACEMGTCVSLVMDMIKRERIDREHIKEQLDAINDYRAWYACGVVEDFTIGDEDFDYSDIIDKLS